MVKSEWIIELTQELKKEAEILQDETECWKKRSIYKLPVHAANLNQGAYIPWVAAIGPYHHSDEHLQRMEEHKKRALRHFLHRSQKPVDFYVDALAEVMNDLMDAYAHLDIAWKQDPKGFLQLMIVDGCFILETMRADSQANEYSTHDLIFSNHGKHNTIPCIKRDMLLLENQVPLLVLEKLHGVESSSTEKSENPLTKLILDFYGRSKLVRQVGKCQHILDMIRKSMILGVLKVESEQLNDEGSLPSATDLKEAGIRFKKGGLERLKDISFKDGTLRLPAISLDDTSESTYLNMVAFERLHVDAGNEISSYIFLMNRLVSDVRDVHLLKSCNIISNVMGSDQDVADLFRTLSKEILVDSSAWIDKVYVEIHKDLQNHVKKMMYRCRYYLIHTYFRSPWAIVSVIAAALGFGLTITQVMYAILSYIHRKN